MAEETIYTDNNVKVTTARVIIHQTTYALRNITSVRLKSESPVKPSWPNILLIIGIVLLFFGAIPAIAGHPGDGAGLLVIGGVIVALAIAGMRKGKDTYYVTIASSAGETNALSSYDRDYISKIVEAINDAFVRYR